MSENTSGTFRQRSNNSIEYRFRYTDADGNVQRKSVSGPTREDCLLKADEFLKKYGIKNLEMGMGSTVSEIMTIKYKSDFDKGYTNEPGYARNIDSLKLIAKSRIGNIPLVDLTEDDLERFLIDMTKYADSTINKAYRQVNRAYKEAIKKGLVISNPLESDDFRCPRSKKETKKVLALTEEEQTKLLEGLETHKPPKNRNDYRLQLKIELYTGMRMGEINALRPDDIDLDRGLIHVRGTISRGVNFRIYYKKHPKTDAGVRDIPIHDKVRPILEEALANMKENPEGLIFYDYNKDSPISTEQVRNFYGRLCERIGITDCGQHALRHTFATRCIEAGVQPVVLKNWLGHTDIHVTLDTYADVYKRLNDNAINMFVEHISQLAG